MSAAVGTFAHDIAESRARTRRTMTVSVIAHALLLLAVVFVRTEPAASPPLVEITLLDPSEAGAAAPGGPAAPAAKTTTAGMAASAPSDEHFRRTRATADLRPTPASDVAVDRLAARLATLRSGSEPEVAGAGTTPTSAAWSAPAAVGGRGTGGSAPLALTRGGGTGAGPPLAMTRGGAGGSSALAPAALPARSAVTEAPAQAGDAGMRRTVAGASLAGPIADRSILSFVRPSYPDWAKRDAVEGTVTLYFIVRPDGTVKENVLVQRTAGFEDFDENARSALRAWRFEPLRAGRTGEQWGTITFRYRLEGGS